MRNRIAVRHASVADRPQQGKRHVYALELSILRRGMDHIRDRLPGPGWPAKRPSDGIGAGAQLLVGSGGGGGDSGGSGGIGPMRFCIG